MDRENNDRGMIDRTVGEKKEFSFPAVHFPVMAWASLVCFACFALYLSCPPSAGRDAPRAMFGPRLHSRENGLPAAFGPVKTEGFMKNEPPCPPSFGPARCGPRNLIFTSQMQYPLSFPNRRWVEEHARRQSFAQLPVGNAVEEIDQLPQAALVGASSIIAPIPVARSSLSRDHPCRAISMSLRGAHAVQRFGVAQLRPEEAVKGHEGEADHRHDKGRATCRTDRRRNPSAWAGPRRP